jgi:hypothetical protein
VINQYPDQCSAPKASKDHVFVGGFIQKKMLVDSFLLEGDPQETASPGQISGPRSTGFVCLFSFLPYLTAGISRYPP